MSTMQWYPKTRRGFIKAIVRSYHEGTGLFHPDMGDLVSISWACRQPYTFTEITVNIEGQHIKGYGFSKVCYPDEFDSSFGLNITEDRAIHDLAEQLWAAKMSVETEVRIAQWEGV